MHPGFFDRGPVNVSGAITARRARVMYVDGKLHIFKTRTSHVQRETPEPVEIGPETWEAGDVTFTRKGCPTCGWSLGKIPPLELLASVE